MKQGSKGLVGVLWRGSYSKSRRGFFTDGVVYLTWQSLNKKRSLGERICSGVMAGGGHSGQFWNPGKLDLPGQSCPGSPPLPQEASPGGSWVSPSEKRGRWLWGGGFTSYCSSSDAIHSSRGPWSLPVSSQRGDPLLNNETNPKSQLGNSAFQYKAVF